LNTPDREQHRGEHDQATAHLKWRAVSGSGFQPFAVAGQDAYWRLTARVMSATKVVAWTQPAAMSR
jgi:hypothetical protein